MNPVRILIELKRDYPYTVTVNNYVSRAKAGELPRIDDIQPKNFGSWVKRRHKNPKNDHDRVFAFKTHDALIAFKKKYEIL